MLFTVIIPVYNRATVVQRTLDTVLSQTYRPLQLVLVDNCSTDRSLQVLQQFKQCHEADDFLIDIVQEPHHTAGAARNRGFGHARGEWVMFFDSDDEMAATLVETYVDEVSRRSGEVDLVSVRSVLVFPDGTRREAPFFTSDIFAVQLLHSQLATQRYAVRREFFAATDGWNIDLPGWNDWELGARLLLCKPRLSYCDKSPMVFINHNGKDSITGTEFHSRAGQWEHVIDLVQSEVQDAAWPQSERYVRLLHYRRLVLAAQYDREGCPELAEPLRRCAIDGLRDSYGDGWRWKVWIAPVMRILYDRIVAGKRGSARVARRIF